MDESLCFSRSQSIISIRDNDNPVARLDFVTLADGERGSDVLSPGEIGRVIQDLRHGSMPFMVEGHRGQRGWFRGESLVVIPPKRRSSVRRLGTKPLVQQVVAALDPHTQLDFPTITEICDVAAQTPAEAEVGIAVLIATLGEQKIKSGDARNITQDYYKVLTIINEMLYDEELVEILRRTPGLTPALERLKNFTGGDKGEPVDENIRILANEIEKTVFHDNRKAARPMPRMEIILFCSVGHLLSWRSGLSLFHIHKRQCALCLSRLLSNEQRYNCRACRYYDICISCARWGTPQKSDRRTVGALSDMPLRRHIGCW